MNKYEVTSSDFLVIIKLRVVLYNNIKRDYNNKERHEVSKDYVKAVKENKSLSFSRSLLIKCLKSIKLLLYFFFIFYYFYNIIY